MRKRTTPAQLLKHRGERTQEQMAKSWNTPKPTYVQWERGLRRIPGIVSVVVQLEKRR